MGDPRESTTSPEIGRLKRRAEFLRVGAGRRWHAAGMTVQAAPAGGDERGIRVGFTLTRKVGGAVVRNRIRRRLKEAVRLASDLPARAGHDYVILGRVEALRLPFAALQGELRTALEKVHEAGRARRPQSKDERASDRARDKARTRQAASGDAMNPDTK